MNVYRLTYIVCYPSEEYRHDKEVLVAAESKDDAIRKGIDYIIAERERWGYTCDYDGVNVFVCYHSGNLCETYTDFKVEEV